MNLKRTLIALSALALLTTAASAQLIYDNTITSTGYYFANEGATNIGGNTITALVADDITPAAGYVGQTISRIGFGVVNGNGASVTLRPLLRMWDGTGTGGGPGNLINGWNFNPVTISGNSFQGFTFTPNGLTVPSGLFWLGMTFDDNNGTTGISVTQLNSIGMALFNPPAIGTSQDAFFVTDTAGSFLVNNPVGGIYWFNGNPVANFYFSIQVVPEPTGMALMGLAGLIAFAVRRRSA